MRCANCGVERLGGDYCWDCEEQELNNDGGIGFDQVREEPTIYEQPVIGVFIQMTNGNWSYHEPGLMYQADNQKVYTFLDHLIQDHDLKKDLAFYNSPEFLEECDQYYKDCDNGSP